MDVQTGRIPAEYGKLEHVLPPGWKTVVAGWLKEDCPSFDYGGFVVGDKQESAILYGKTPGVLAGVPFFEEVFQQLDCTVEWNMKEGESFEPIRAVAMVHGVARNLLLGERVALNTLARCSGIANQSRRLLKFVRDAGYVNVLAGTRKTTPGFRIVEKYGMLVGGIDAHRIDLSHATMLKDNHIWSKGSITAAVHAARSIGGFSTKVEVEVASEDGADEAIAAGADIVMLDNFSGEGLKTAARSIKERHPGSKVLLECSGGLTEGNVSGYLCNDIDIYSTSSVHQSVPHVDYSLKIKQSPTAT